MTPVDDDREKDFAVIRNSIPPGYDEPSEDQQEAVDRLDKELRDQYGFDPNAKRSEEEEQDGEGKTGRGPTKSAIVLAVVRASYPPIMK